MIVPHTTSIYTYINYLLLHYMCTNYHTIAISIKVISQKLINLVHIICGHIFLLPLYNFGYHYLCFLKIYRKGKLRITRKNRKRLRIFFFFQVLTDYQKSNPPYYNFFHNISIEFTSYDVGLGKHLSSTGAHYLNISIKLWDTIWLSYSNALRTKIFLKIATKF